MRVDYELRVGGFGKLGGGDGGRGAIFLSQKRAVLTQNSTEVPFPKDTQLQQNHTALPTYIY